MNRFQSNKSFRCCLCDRISHGYGNNAHPLVFPAEAGYKLCCEECNAYKVVPARLLIFSLRIKGEEEQSRVMREYMEAPSAEKAQEIITRYKSLTIATPKIDTPV